MTQTPPDDPRESAPAVPAWLESCAVRDRQLLPGLPRAVQPSWYRTVSEDADVHADASAGPRSTMAPMTTSTGPVPSPDPTATTVQGQALHVLAHALDGRCPRCLRPQATAADWDAIPEGEGDHLCWDSPTTCWQEPADDRTREHLLVAALNDAGLLRA